MRRVFLLFLATVVSVAWMSPARANLPGIPNAPIPAGKGLSLSADYADPEHAGSAWGLTGGFGFQRLGLAAGIGTYDFAGEDVTTFSAGAGLSVIQAGPVNLGAQLSLGIYDPGAGTVTDLFPGASGQVDLPAFPLKPYAVVYAAMLDGADDEFRFALGASFSVLPTIGIHAAYDWGDNNSTWGIGAHFNFSVPGT